MQDAIDRKVCFCGAQFKMGLEVTRLWKCTGPDAVASMLPGETRLCNITDDAPPNVGLQVPWVYTAIARQGGDGVEVRLDRPIVLPLPSVSSTYYRACRNHVPRRNCASTQPFDFDSNTCYEVCSFRELKEFIDAKYVALETAVFQNILSEVETLIYDLKWIIDLLDESTETFAEDDTFEFGEDVAQLFRLTPAGEPIRLDACECQYLFKCPNGTQSIVGATSVYDCIPQKEVLFRATPFLDPDVNPRLRPFPDPDHVIHRLSDPWNPISEGLAALRTIPLQAWEVATVTIDLRHLPINMTYDTHYRFGVYVNCKPCPPQYRCAYEEIIDALTGTVSEHLPLLPMAHLPDRSSCLPD